MNEQKMMDICAAAIASTRDAIDRGAFSDFPKESEEEAIALLCDILLEGLASMKMKNATKEMVLKGGVE